jgi:hypothetical protein
MNEQQPYNINKSYTVGDVTNAIVTQGEENKVNVTGRFINQDSESLTDVVIEIQKLLERFSQSHPNPTTYEQLKNS